MDEIPSLLSKNLLQCLVGQLSAKDSNLHSLAERCRQALLARAKRQPEVTLPFLTSIFKIRGLTHFDQITKTRTVEKLLSCADTPALEALVPILRNLLVSPRAKDEQDAMRIRQSVADHLLAIVRLQDLSEQEVEKLQGSRAIVDAGLEVLATCAYFEQVLDQGRPPSHPFSSQTHKVLKSRIMSCLTYLLDKDVAPHHHPSLLAIHLTDKEWQEQRVSRMELAESLSRPAELLRKIRETATTTNDNSTVYHAFELLLSLTILLIYNGEADAVGMADELQQCYDGMASDEKMLEERGKAVEALVEILLGLLSKPSLLFRRLAQQVFPTIAQMLNQQGIASLVRILEAPESSAGQSSLFDVAEENEDEEMLDANGSDVEEVNTENEITAVDEVSEKLSGSELSEADDEDHEEAAAFEAKLAQALGTRAADEDINDLGSESPDADMNDEQMEALDDQIATIFRQRKLQPNKNKENQDTKAAMIQFKCRVLELLELFVKRVPNSRPGIDLLRPLLGLVKQTSSGEARNKAASVIREWLKAYKLDVDVKGSDTQQLDNVRGLLRDVHGLAGQDGPNVYRSACSQASLLLVKIMLASGGTIADAWQQYAETGSSFVTDRASAVKSQFFTDWLNWCVSAKQAYGRAAKEQ